SFRFVPEVVPVMPRFVPNTAPTSFRFVPEVVPAMPRFVPDTAPTSFRFVPISASREESIDLSSHSNFYA
ncbi:MAG: hypothetical protein LBM17_07395, partial [Candidatus Accumulibacter sp.]|nr:hypothetical protein [Accumulibacter sp.]